MTYREVFQGWACFVVLVGVGCSSRPSPSPPDLNHGEASGAPPLTEQVAAKRWQVPQTLADLPRERWLEIDYKSTGCFHNFSRTIVIRWIPGPVAEISDPGDGGRGHVSLIPLSQEDVLGLDRLFAFYREGESGWHSTTQKTVILRWRGGRDVGPTERFVDRSAPTPNSVLELWKLIDRAERPAAPDPSTGLSAAEDPE